MADIFSTLLATDRHALEVRFWAKVAKSEDGCWLWTGAHNGRGYGRFGIGGRAGVTHYAHRVSFWLEFGRWPGDLCCLHKCDRPSCVNPAHLFLGSVRDNAWDMSAKRRSGPQRHPESYADIVGRIAAARRARTHCKRWHEFTPANTYITAAGMRRCRECARRVERERRARIRAAT